MFCKFSLSLFDQVLFAQLSGHGIIITIKKEIYFNGHLLSKNILAKEWQLLIVTLRIVPVFLMLMPLFKVGLEVLYYNSNFHNSSFQEFSFKKFCPVQLKTKIEAISTNKFAANFLNFSIAHDYIVLIYFYLFIFS